MYALTRRSFLKSSMVLGASAPFYYLVSCNGNALNASEDAVMGSITDNHLHQALVPKNMLVTESELTIDITGNSDHPHVVRLSKTDLTAIQNGVYVLKQSSRDWGHEHQVIFNPEGPRGAIAG